MGLLQVVCAGILAACILNMYYWLDGTFDISELGRRFEETGNFLQLTEDTIRRKIACTQNFALFQTGGETDLDKKIDIRQYVSGVQDEANLNENTTYRIRDLIDFFPDMSALRRVLAEQDMIAADPSEQTWDSLNAKTAGLETVLPLSGSRLAETARLSARPYETLMDYYSALCQTCSDIGVRYDSYLKEMENPEGTSHADAPSNIRYYVENSLTKQYYTNLGAASSTEARNMIASDGDLTFLFDGVRSMAIMVANSENTLSERVASKFIDTVFLGSGERVVIAVNPGYPAGDEFHGAYLAYERREPVVIASIVIGASALACMIILFVLSICRTGRRDKDTLYPIAGFDLVPSEIAAGLCMLAGILWYYAALALLRRWIPPDRRSEWIVFSAAAEYGIFLLSMLSLARRLKWKKLWQNSVLYTVLRVSSQIMAARITSRLLLVFYTAFIFLNLLLPRYLGAAGAIIVFVVDLAVLLYLIRDQVGKLSVREGLREISKGKLDYRIDTGSLAGDSLEMAEAVNEMGVGLQEAVDAMVRSERLKAELITNVSHDLKTPLTSIINYVGLLSREAPESGKIREYVDILDRKSQRLKVLISDLIEASRISSGNVELELSEMDLRQMLLMAEGEFEERFEELSLSVHTDTGRESAVITADGSQLWRVLDNLLSNIAKYAKEGSEVRISLIREDGMAKAVFENESEAELIKSGEELEERFVRGDLARNSEGSGLGLSIAKNLTELMGGSFEVRTEPHRFTACITFPLVSSPSVKNP